MKYAVNSNSLPETYVGNPKAKTSVKYIIIEPNGDSDEVRYTSWYDAVYVLLDCQGIGDKLTKEMNADGVYHTAEINNHDVSDWLCDNAEQVLKENGYRILEVLR